MPLHIIQSLQDPLLRLLEDDPVRPEIPASFRVGAHTEIFVLQNAETLEPEAVVCVAYRDLIPADILELARDADEDISVAVFYTIWSYRQGAGRRLIQQAVRWIQRNRKSIREFVTLSPQTDMARRFHIHNGALEFRRNGDTVNYLYSVSDEADHQ
jgi:hypothetical protein